MLWVNVFVLIAACHGGRSWSQLAAYFSLAIVVLSAAFSLAYMLDIDGFEVPESYSSNGRHRLGLSDIFLFAFSQTCNGGSPLSPHSSFLVLLSNLHALTSQLLFVFVTGVVFARLSRPGPSIRLSAKLFIGEYQHQYCVMARMVVPRQPPELLDTRVHLTLRNMAENFYHARDLQLVRSEMAHLKYAVYIRHVVDESSPLHGYDLARMIAEQVSFRLTVMATEVQSMQPVFKTQEYYAECDDIVFGLQPEDLVRSLNGVRVIDYSQLDRFKPVLPLAAGPAVSSPEAAASASVPSTQVAVPALAMGAISSDDRSSPSRSPSATFVPDPGFDATQLTEPSLFPARAKPIVRTSPSPTTTSSTTLSASAARSKRAEAHEDVDLSDRETRLKLSRALLTVSLGLPISTAPPFVELRPEPSGLSPLGSGRCPLAPCADGAAALARLRSGRSQPPSASVGRVSVVARAQRRSSTPCSFDRGRNRSTSTATRRN